MEAQSLAGSDRGQATVEGGVLGARRRRQATHKVFPKTAEFGGCSPPAMWEMYRGRKRGRGGHAPYGWGSLWAVQVIYNFQLWCLPDYPGWSARPSHSTQVMVTGRKPSVQCSDGDIRG